jgi:hypothetical protein
LLIVFGALALIAGESTSKNPKMPSLTCRCGNRFSLARQRVNDSIAFAKVIQASNGESQNDKQP